MVLPRIKMSPGMVLRLGTSNAEMLRMVRLVALVRDSRETSRSGLLEDRVRDVVIFVRLPKLTVVKYGLLATSMV